MSASEAHDRSHLQTRIREEIARAERHDAPFALVVFESLPGSDGLPMRKKLDAALERLERRLRPSDVIGKAFDDTIAALLVQTDAAGLADVMPRLRGALIGVGAWNVEWYVYPKDRAAIIKAPVLTAA